MPFTDFQRSLARHISRIGLNATCRPYQEIAEQLGTTESRVIMQIADWVEDGTIRRLGARIKHQKAGFKANGMTAWVAPPELLDTLGARLSGEEAVTHCYIRPPFEGFPYTLYAMIHAGSKEEIVALCEMVAAEFNATSATVFQTPDPRPQTPVAYMILWSIKEHKKTVMRYFEEETI